MIFERGYFDKKVVNESKINDSYLSTRTLNASTEYSNKPSVFLSHKHDDLNDLKGVINVFDKLEIIDAVYRNPRP